MIFTPQGSYGLRESRREERLEKQRKFLRFLFKFGFLALIFMAAYWFGGKRYLAENKRLYENIQAEQNRHPELKNEIDELRLDLEKVKTEKSTLVEKYQKEVPQGVSKPLFDILQNRLSDGVTPERLGAVLAEVSNEVRCDASPVLKKLLVETKLQKKSEILGFWGDNVKIKAFGQNTKNPKGLTESWFDPLEPLTLTLENGRNGQKKTFTAKLPFHQNMVIDSKEYRFTLTNGPRGYVQVSALQCAFP